jgi:large subunit ribosomal protein L15e
MNASIQPSKERVRIWRRAQTITRVRKPSKIKRARTLGYKAKPGFVIARIRIKKGGRRRQQIKKGRKPKKSGRVKYTTSQSLQAIAEKRAAKRFPNLEVLNSYYAAEDGQFKYFEIIFLDPNHPQIQKDKQVGFIKNIRGRAQRSLTSASKKSRN